MAKRGRGKRARATRIKVKQVRRDKFLIRALQAAVRRRN